MSRKARDLTGQVFGRLIAKLPLTDRRQRSVLWRCICCCGNTVNVASRSLVSGGTRSCGCLRAEVLRARKLDGVLVGHVSAICAVCSRPFLGRSSREKYCSAECRKTANKAWWLVRYAAERRPVVTVSCANCGSAFETANSRFRFCSEGCRKRLDWAARGAIRRGILEHYEAFDPFIVFDRDGWACRSCGVETPRYLRGTGDPRSPELDHVVPLSRGGPHTIDNTQCLCRRCNMAKGAKLGQADQPAVVAC